MSKATRQVDGDLWLAARRAKPSWYILRPLPQRDAAAKAFLQANDIHSFYPTIKKVVERNGKRYTTKESAAKGYLAARIGANPNWYWLFTRGQRFIAGALPASDGLPMPMGQKQIKEFQEISQRQEDAEAALEAAALIRVGDVVRVILGPFDGCMGEVLEDKGTAVIVAGVEMWGKPVAVPKLCVLKEGG